MAVLVVASLLGVISIFAWPTSRELSFRCDTPKDNLEVFSGQRVQMLFTFHNTSTVTAVIEDSRVSCSCMGLFSSDGRTPFALPQTVKPGDMCQLVAVVDTNNRFGTLNANVAIMGRIAGDAFRADAAERISVRERFRAVPGAVVFPDCQPGRVTSKRIVIHHYTLRDHATRLQEILTSRPECLTATIVESVTHDSTLPGFCVTESIAEVIYHPPPTAPSRTEALTVISSAKEEPPFIIPVRIQHTPLDYVAEPDSVFLVMSDDSEVQRRLRCRARISGSKLIVRDTPAFLTATLRQSEECVDAYDLMISASLPKGVQFAKGMVLIGDEMRSDHIALSVPIHIVRSD